MVGAYLFITGILRILSNHGVCGFEPTPYYNIVSAITTTTSQRGRKNSAVRPAGSGFTFRSKKKKRNFEPGGNLFWVTCVVTFLIGIVLQTLRCFFVTGSYATTSAKLTFAQLCVMTAQVNLSLYMYYTQSSFGFTIVRFCADIAYFIVRLSALSHLSMHSSDFIDFLTMVVPLMLCAKDIDSMTKFIRLPLPAKNSAESLSFINVHRGKVAIISGLVATVLGVIGLIEVYNRHEECSSNVVPLAEGFECMDWQFNLYLDPSCSCSYMHINVPECEESKAGFQDNSLFHQDANANVSQSTVQEVAPSFKHIEDSQLLVINYAPGCIATNSNHSKFISGFKDLQMVSLQAASFEEFPPDLSDFPNLVAVYLNAPHLKQIESEMLDSWPKLQVVHCSPCPSLDSEGLFAYVDLPRLQSVQLEGVSTCSDDTQFGLKEQLKNYECTNRNDTACGNMPQWILQHHVNRVQRTTHTDCNEPSCGFFLDKFKIFDNTYSGAPEPDALFNAFEFRRYLKYIGFPGVEDISDKSYECMFEMMREQIPFEQTLYQGLELSHGMTLFEFLASQSAHTNCAACQSTQGKSTSGAENFGNQQKILATYPYQCVESNVPFVEPEKFRQACNPPKRSCDPQCGYVLEHLTESDEGDDYRHTEAEFLRAATKESESHLSAGAFQCFYALGGSQCIKFNNSEGWENLQVPFDQLIPMWVFVMDWYVDKEPTSCRDCWDVVSEVEGCWDDDTFTDSHDDNCDRWRGFDCLEYYLLSNGEYDFHGYYSKEDIAHVIFNCPVSCGICHQFGDPD